MRAWRAVNTPTSTAPPSAIQAGMRARVTPPSCRRRRSSPARGYPGVCPDFRAHALAPHVASGDDPARRHRARGAGDFRRAGLVVGRGEARPLRPIRRRRTGRACLTDAGFDYVNVEGILRVRIGDGALPADEARHGGGRREVRRVPPARARGHRRGRRRLRRRRRRVRSRPSAEGGELASVTLGSAGAAWSTRSEAVRASPPSSAGTRARSRLGATDLATSARDHAEGTSSRRDGDGSATIGGAWPSTGIRLYDYFDRVRSGSEARRPSAMLKHPSEG